LIDHNQDSNNFQVFESETSTLGLISLEINISLKKTEWEKYEQMNSEIFAHLTAVLPEFQLIPFSKNSR
jgi:hypothetical protein